MFKGDSMLKSLNSWGVRAQPPNMGNASESAPRYTSELGATTGASLANTVSSTSTWVEVSAPTYVNREQYVEGMRNELTRAEFHRIPAEEYTQTKNLRILAGTWNVNGRAPEADLDLTKWLFPDDNPDVLLLGFQEIVALNSANTLFGQDTATPAKWDALIRETLNGSRSSSLDDEPSQAEPDLISLLDWDAPRSAGTHQTSDPVARQREDVQRYFQVASRQLVGVYMSVWVRAELLGAISDVAISTVSTGWGGYLGNKGSVAIQMTIYDDPICCVCSHFASGEAPGDQEKRNADYTDASKRIGFPSRKDNQKALSIQDHSTVIWMGDLNYRMNFAEQVVHSYIQMENWTELLTGDQLTTERALGKVFQQFQEGAIMFKPTYKYRLGTDIFSGDPLVPKEGEKRRAPAWCDRILWRGESLKQLAYTLAQPSLNQSDHRPVVSIFTMEVDMIVPELAEKAVRAAYMRVDAAEMANRPKCSVSTNALEFGEMRWGSARQQELRLTNDGERHACFQFVSEAEGAPPRPPWLDVSPLSGVLPPAGDARVWFTTRVCARSPGVAERLMCSDGPELSGILVLRIVGGQDIFVTVHGTYAGSCFGLGLQQLATLPRPIFAASDANKITPPTHELLRISTGEPVHVNLPPPEIASMIAFLRRHATSITKADWSTREDDGTAVSVDADSHHSGTSQGAEEVSTFFEDPLIDLGLDVNSSASSEGASAAALLASAPTSGSMSTSKVVQLLDSGADADQLSSSGCTFHAVLQTLLRFFADMPDPVMPQLPDSLSQVCESVYVPSAEAAASAMFEQLCPAVYVTFFVTVYLVRELVALTHTIDEDAAEALARVWFTRVDDELVMQRRTQLVKLFLLPTTQLHIPISPLSDHPLPMCWTWDITREDRETVHAALGLAQHM